MRAVIVAAFVIAASRDARAEDSEATVLFQRGRELVKAGDHTAACPLFEQSLRLAPAIGTELNLARCYAATGKLAAARVLFVHLTKTIDPSDQQRADLARDGLADVDKRAPSLRVELGAELAGASVTIDGEPVDIAGPIAVDIGEHTVAAPGARTVVYTAREAQSATVQLAAVVHHRKRVVWATGGAALGALALGTITGIATIRVRNAGNRHCVATDGALLCDQRGIDLFSHARTLSHVTTVSFLAGLGLAAATAVLELRGRREQLPPLRVDAADGAVTMSYGGAW